eukprot:CAMPEP_0119008432 /NCGR_PEP_ID=MMETSP1176-20130426/3690_1 /TAXON_ID=265551 /ORGANISM="Synedropsis recta cf, Strain CCMP1620" /LENGTH=884 /DNA_ID=CAMNT_0006960759 /DNA_START=72 /DNA_END=2726 /DNA_ORIENTATION=-
MPTKRASSRRGIDDGEEDSFQPTAPRRRGEAIPKSAPRPTLVVGSGRFSSVPSRNGTESFGDLKPFPPPCRTARKVGATNVTSIKSSGSILSMNNPLRMMRAGARSRDPVSIDSSEEGSSVFIFMDDDEESSAFIVTKSTTTRGSSQRTVHTSNQRPPQKVMGKSKNGSNIVGYNWTEAASVSGSTVKSAKSENSISSSTVTAARREPKLRHQTVIYVNGPDNAPMDHPSREVMEATVSGDCFALETQLIAGQTGETDATVPLAAELVDMAHGSFMEIQMRERIFRESVHAEVVGHRKQVQAFAKKYWWVLVVFMALTVGISIAVALLISSGNGSSGNSTLVSDSPTVPPTTVPSSPPSTNALLQRYYSFHDILRPMSGDLLDIQDSPQRNALLWLIEQDGAKLIPENTQKREIEERYILAVVFFATNGPQWATKYNFLSSDHFCSWNAETLDDGINGAICSGSGYVAQLDLTRNNLQGTIPPEVGFLYSLTEFDLNLNAISGTLPSTLGQLTRLKELDFDVNMLTGSIPSELFRIKPLEILWLDDNALSGSLPANIGNANMLDSIALKDNRLTGTVPNGISTLAWMQRLDLEGNSFVGPLPSFEGNTALVRLYLGNNQFTGNIPSTIGNCTLLQQIRISNALVDGPIPPELAAMPNLNSVVLINNTLTGSIPAFVSIRKNLETIGLYNNRLSGSLDAFFDIPSNRLSVVDFESNLLSGTVPASLGMHTTLEYLVLADNVLTGTLPTMLGKLTSVEKFFQFFANQLNGTIPSELGQLTRLSEIALSTNQFTGPIPSELGRLSNLNSLYLAANLLTGRVPVEISTLPTLEFMFVHKNNLTGDFGSSFCARVDGLDELGADCVEEVICTCCTYCCDSNDVCNNILI